MGGAAPWRDRGGAAGAERLTPLPPHAGQPLAQLGKPLGEGRAAMIMVHGRNAGPRNILALVPALEHADFTYLAPAARDNTWYPYSFLEDIQKNEPGISSGISVIHQLIDDVLASGIPVERIVLLGFSQGACLAATAAVRRPARYGGVIALSGGLIGPPGTVWDGGSFDRAPAFLGCSDPDPHVPTERVDESAAVFERMGAAVTKRIYPNMGHVVNDDEVAFVREIMARAAG